MKRRVAILLTMTIAAAALASAESRWQYVTTSNDKSLVYIDTQSYEYPEYQGAARGDYVNFWAKFAAPDKTVMLIHYQLHRSGKRTRILGYVFYSASGAVTGTSSAPSTDWHDIVPDSVLEAFLRLFSDTTKNTPPPIHA
jgi:hypothetical protein